MALVLARLNTALAAKCQVQRSPDRSNHLRHVDLLRRPAQTLSTTRPANRDNQLVMRQLSQDVLQGRERQIKPFRDIPRAVRLRTSTGKICHRHQRVIRFPTQCEHVSCSTLSGAKFAAANTPPISHLLQDRIGLQHFSQLDQSRLLDLSHALFAQPQQFSDLAQCQA